LLWDFEGTDTESENEREKRKEKVDDTKPDNSLLHAPPHHKEDYEMNQTSLKNMEFGH
jgi:hypothetical protein